MLAIVLYIRNIISKKFIMALYSLTPLSSACVLEPYLIHWCDNVIREQNAGFFGACCKILLCTEGVDTWYAQPRV